MIFVSVGTHEDPFDRLLRACEGLAGDEELVVQHGPSSVRPAGATCVEYMSFDEVVANVRRARAVVMHAGVGSVMVALANGKRPIVVPRLHRCREHVDDHQLSLARRLAEVGLVTMVEDPQRDLRAAVAEEPQPVGVLEGRGLAAELGEYLTEQVGAGARTIAAAG